MESIEMVVCMYILYVYVLYACMTGMSHLNECIQFSDGRDELWNEALQGRLQLHLLRLVSLDVLEEVSNLCGHVQLQIVLGIVRALDVLVALLVLSFLVAGALFSGILLLRGRRRRRLLGRLLCGCLHKQYTRTNNDSRGIT